MPEPEGEVEQVESNAPDAGGKVVVDEQGLNLTTPEKFLPMF